VIAQLARDDEAALRQPEDSHERGRGGAGEELLERPRSARVYPGPVKEVGFHPLTVRDMPAAAPLRHLEGVPVLHWHGGTFDLPDGAELLASSERYAHQAFRVGANVLALQFHAEMGLEACYETWVER
jgi:GMP synthase (glutamine-hydrolysing)